MRRFRLPLLITLAVLVVFVGWRVREATDGTYRTQRQLQQVPEEHMVYPDSTVLERFGADLELDVLNQRTRAYSGYTLGTNATEEEVRAFYRGRLTATGWRDAPAEVSLSSGQARGDAYRKDSLLLQITILRKGDIRNDPATNSYQTPYQTVLRADLPR